MDKRTLAVHEHLRLVLYEPSGEVRIEDIADRACSGWLAPAEVDAIRAAPTLMPRYRLDEHDNNRRDE
jgi:hypothetical protein